MSNKLIVWANNKRYSIRQPDNNEPNRFSVTEHEETEKDGVWIIDQDGNQKLAKVSRPVQTREVTIPIEIYEWIAAMSENGLLGRTPMPPPVGISEAQSKLLPRVRIMEGELSPDEVILV